VRTKIGKSLFGGWLALLCSLTNVGSAQQQPEPLDALLSDVAAYWAPYTDERPTSTTVAPPTAVAEFATVDEELTPVQMLTPQPRTAPRVTQRPRRSAVARRNTKLSSVPFMIGDTGAGSCVSFGNLISVALGHPTLGCSRLNIAEGNTPLPTDRVYFSYRHFDNATPTRVFANFEDFDVDRFTLGGERTFFNGMLSAEIRLPIENRLSSEIGTNIAQFDPPFLPGAVLGNNPITSDRRTELANISLVFKALLIERTDYAISAGLGVTLPTARDVIYDAIMETFVQRDVLSLDYVALTTIAANETVYLAPFLSWIWKPTPKFFHQGFLQVEVAANNSPFSAVAAGQVTVDLNGDDFFDPFDPTDGTISYNTPSNPLAGFGPGLGITELQPQTLMRLNLGFGYVLAENPHADWIQKLTALFEVHYTTTLNKAKINSIPLSLAFNGISLPPGDPAFAGFDAIEVGNLDNRIDIVNLVAGLSADVGNWVVTNGVTAPITTGSNRGFDFEYNLQVQRPF